MVGKKKGEPLFSTFEKYRLFPTLLGAIMPDSPQHVGELLERPDEEKKDLIAARAVLVSEMEVVEVEMTEKKEGREKY